MGHVPDDRPWRSLGEGAVRRLAIVGIVVSTLCGSASAGGAREPGGDPATPRIRVEDRRLSVRLSRVPLAQALRAILERTGMDLTVVGDVAEEVTIAFDDLSLEEGLEVILRPRSYVLIYPAEGGQQGGRLDVIAVTPGRPTGAGSKQPPAVDQERVGLNRRGPRAGADAAQGVAEVEEMLLRERRAEQLRSYLAAVLEGEDDQEVRKVALKALTKIDPVALDLIAEVALQDPSRAVRFNAVELLMLRPEWGGLVLETLQIVARSDPDETVRGMAAAFVERLGRSND
jgi:hypothetical protein